MINGDFTAAAGGPASRSSTQKKDQLAARRRWRWPLDRAEHHDPAVRRHQRPQGGVAGFDRDAPAPRRAAARSSATSRRTTSRRAWRASRRPAGWRAPATTSSPTRRPTWPWPPGVQEGGLRLRQVRRQQGVPDGRGQRRARGRRRPRSRSSSSRTSASRSACARSRTMRCTRSSATCRRPRSRSARTSAGCKDFADPQTILDPTFNGDEHHPGRTTRTGRSSTYPEINKAMDEAALLDRPGRARQGMGRHRPDDHASRPRP